MRGRCAKFVNVVFVSRSLARSLAPAAAAAIELRALVANRYRDLIYSADSIVHMRDASTTLVQNVDGVLRACETLFNSNVNGNDSTRHDVTTAAASASANNKSSSNNKNNSDVSPPNNQLAIAKQIKQLVDTPEKIWAGL